MSSSPLQPFDDPAVMEGYHLALREAFERFAVSQGMPVGLASQACAAGAIPATDRGACPATYADHVTEMAWRTWANQARPVFAIRIGSAAHLDSAIPRDQKTWIVHATNQKLLAREATAADIERVGIEGPLSRSPSDWLCELSTGRALIDRRAVIAARMVNDLFANPSILAS